MSAFEGHNSDLGAFKEASSQAISGKRDLKKKAEELQRIALKQKQLDCIEKQLRVINREKEDRQLQKALLGTLFIWYEKGNDNLIPLKKPD